MLWENRENLSPTSMDCSFNVDITYNAAGYAATNHMDMDMNDGRRANLSEEQMRELYRQYHMQRTGMGPEY
jgi:hypothetical protein